MTKVKVKTKITTLKVVELTLKTVFMTAFLSTWLYVIYHMIFIYPS